MMCKKKLFLSYSSNQINTVYAKWNARKYIDKTVTKWFKYRVCPPLQNKGIKCGEERKCAESNEVNILKEK